MTGNHNNVNWITATQLLLFLKQGLQSFVANGIQEVSDTLLEDVRRENGIPEGKETHCEQCQNNRESGGNYKNCNYNNKNKQCEVQNCQNDKCHNIALKIKKLHRFKSPHLKGTKSNRWCEDPWEIAKCFISTDGYSETSSAEDTDCAGLLSIVENCKYFDNKVSTNLTKVENTFSRARQTRNVIFHDAEHSVSDHDLIQWTDKLIAPLEDTKELTKDENAKAAVLEMKAKLHEVHQSIEDRKSGLTKALRDKYRRHLGNVQVSPIVKNVCADIDEIYTDLVIRESLINKPRIPMAQLTRRVRSYSDIFLDQDHQNRKIFVIGEAGVGKTTWCLKFIRNWVDGLDNREHDYELNDDQAFALRFEFIFFVQFRIDRASSNLTNMIESQLFPDLCDKRLFEVAIEVLDHEPAKCLVIQDGLDEWSVPVHLETLDQTGLPARSDNAYLTILTTTRPWKLETVKLPTSEIDQAVEIEGICSHDTTTLIEHIIATLNKQSFPIRRPKDCISLVKKRSGSSNALDIANLMKTPLLLIMIVYLWHKHGDLDKNICNTYFNLIEVLIHNAHTSGKINRALKNEVDSELRGLLQRNKHTSKNTSLLMKIGKMAFMGMFDCSKEQSLIFTSDTLQSFLSEDEIDNALRIGILSKSQAYGSHSNFRISFIHATFQEFLAAVFVASESQQGHESHVQKLFDTVNSFDKVKYYKNIVHFLYSLGGAFSNQIIEHIFSIQPELKYDPSCGLYTYRQLTFLSYILTLNNDLDSVKLLNIVLPCGHYNSLLFGNINKATCKIALYLNNVVDITEIKNATPVKELYLRMTRDMLPADVEPLCQLFKTLTSLESIYVECSLKRGYSLSDIFQPDARYTCTDVKTIHLQGPLGFLLHYFEFPGLKELTYEPSSGELHSIYVLNTLQKCRHIETLEIRWFGREKTRLDIRPLTTLKKFTFSGIFYSRKQTTIILGKTNVKTLEDLTVKRAQLVFERVDAATKTKFPLLKIELTRCAIRNNILKVLLNNSTNLQVIKLCCISEYEPLVPRQQDLRIPTSCISLKSVDLESTSSEQGECVVHMQCLGNLTSLRLKNYCLKILATENVRELENLQILKLDNATLEGRSVRDIIVFSSNLVSCSLERISCSSSLQLDFSNCKQLKNLSIILDYDDLTENTSQCENDVSALKKLMPKCKKCSVLDSKYLSSSSEDSDSVSPESEDENIVSTEDVRVTVKCHRCRIV